MKVQWLKLSLKGFGRFRETVAVDFAPGVNICLAANEQGKSTVAAGLAGVIFGLPSSSDPKAFSQERFRNWHGPAQFSGELEFAAGGELFRLQRNFDNHRVSLQRFVNGSWQEEIGGEHNPRAQKRNMRYEERITQLLGVGNRELFTATFQVTQPLPEGEKIVPGIQQLLSGAGAHYKEALDDLGEALKKITRYTGKREISPRDMNQDRMLEICDKEIFKLEQELSAAAQLLNDVRETAAALENMQDRFNKQSEELAGKERLLPAWQKWRLLRDRYQQAAARQAALAASLEKAAMLERSVENITETLAAKYERYKDCPPDTGEALIVFSSANEEMTVILSAFQETAGEISRESQAAEGLEELLNGELAAVRGRAELPHTCRELRRKELELQDLQKMKLQLSERLADLEKQLQSFPSLDRLGKSPLQSVQTLREQCKAILAQWQQFAKERAGLAQITAQLEEYAPFHCASEEELAVLSVYETRKMRLERELERLNNARSDVLRKVEEVQLAHKAMIREYGEMERLGDDAEAHVERKLELLAAKKEQEEKLRHTTIKIAPREWPRRAVIALAALISGIIASYAGANLPVAFAAAAVTVLLTILLTGFLGQRKERSRPQARLGEINIELRQVDALLGSFSVCGEAQLGALRQKLRERLERRKQLTEMREALPGEELLRPLKAELEAAKEEWRLFKELVSKAESVYPDVSAAFNQWRELEREAAQLQARTDDFASLQAPAVQAGMLLDAPPDALRAPWPEIVALGELMGTDTSTVKALLSWLETMDDAWWNQTESIARSFEQILEDTAVVKRELTALTAPGADGARRFDALQQEIASLTLQVFPFDSQTDPMWLESLLARAREAEEGLVRHRAALEALDKQRLDLEEKRRMTEEKLRPLQERLSPLLAEGAPTEVLQRWQEYSRLCRMRAEQGKELAGLLSAYEVKSPGELRTKVADSTNQAVNILKQREELLVSFPALPSFENEDTQALDSRYRELEVSIARLREEQDLLQVSIRQEELRLAKLQGQAPHNIAGGELRLEELRKESHRLRVEAAALEVAYKELSNAISLFSETYRQGLADTATRYFSLFTGNQLREVLLDDQFNVLVKENGKPYAIAQLSQGARDQLYLALRLAVADLLSDDIQLPFIFDDPFLNWDEARLAMMQQTLDTLPAGRQVLLFSHRREFASWGIACRLELSETPAG
ncbi:MAG: hypothetical protein DDT21_00277 [Syntrophomonadaceae bacterium]|nr:hypothetical protein [Bacillota bacterium]